MPIVEIEAQISQMVATVVELQATYNYPETDIGRKLPALMVVYDGLGQDRFHKGAHDIAWRWELSLYLPVDGKTIKPAWDNLKTIVPKILAAFRVDDTLGGTCRDSMISAGEAVTHVPDNPQAVPKYVGHTFILTAQEDTG